MAVNLKDIKKRQTTLSEYERSRELSESEYLEPVELTKEEIKFEFEFTNSGDCFDGDNIFVGRRLLSNICIAGNNVQYIPDYISQKDHDMIIDLLVNYDKQDWNELPRRIVKKYGGDVTSKGMSKYTWILSIYRQ